MRVYCAMCKADVNLGHARCSACGSDNIMIGVTTPDGRELTSAVCSPSRYARSEVF
jgi:hypothetical protein